VGIYRSVKKIIKKINIEKNVLKRLGGWEGIVEYSLMAIVLFLLSGGLVTAFSGERIGGVSGQTTMEFMTFFITNSLFTFSVYLIYKGLTKGKIDVTITSLGIILFVIIFVAEIYILGSIYTR